MRRIAVFRVAVSSAGWIAGLLLGTAAAGNAQAQTQVPSEIPRDMQIVSTLWCDTPEQIETVLKAYYVNKVPLTSAMADINRFDPDACVRARVIVKMGTEVRRFIAGEALISVSEATVHGVMRGPTPMMATKVQTWYSAKVVAELKDI